MITVKNHNDFARFDYVSEPTKDATLGQLVVKNDRIGVVIQTFADGDFRTDMYGITDNMDSKPATIEQVKKFRPELIPHIA